MNTNVYQVIINGNDVVFENANKKPCLRKAIRLASNRNNYVELWYIYSDGKRCLVEFWN